jgi:hypothetical protein
MSSKRLVTGLLLAALFFAILLPPEAYPDGKLVVILCATFAFSCGLAERRIPSSYIGGGLGVFGFLVLHSLVVSVDAYRSFEFTSVIWAYYALLGCLLYSKSDPFKPIAVSFVILCALVSGYGLYQYFFGFEQLYQFVSYSSSAEVFKIPALELIAKGRVISTLSLPGTLWGFLVMAIPFHAALWNGTKLTRGLVAAGFVLLLATGLLTRSFGFLLGLLLLAALAIILRTQGRARRRLMLAAGALAVLLIVVGGAFYLERQRGIEAANPFVLRAKNWVSAWSVFASHPWGTGLNTFGVVYPRYMMPGGNESQYAHNTPLQLLSELGFPVLVAGALLLIFWRRRLPESVAIGRADQSQYLLLGLAVWLLHNTIDIDVYFPSVGIAGVVLLGVYLWKPQTQISTPSRPLLAVTGGLTLALVIFAVLSMVSTELQLRAKGEFEMDNFPAAAATLASAKALMPINSSIHHDLGDVYLNKYQRRGRKPADLEQATESFRTALALSPLKAGSHTGFGLTLASANRVDEARAEVREALRLYPDSTFTQSIARLLERRAAGKLVEKASPDTIPGP